MLLSFLNKFSGLGLGFLMKTNRAVEISVAPVGNPVLSRLGRPNIW
jgi:hypothetical protein